MRTLSDYLKTAQSANSIDVLYKIQLTKGGDSYTYDRSRILPSEHDEEGYSQRAKIILNNSDGEFDAKNLKGFKAVLSYGAVTGSGDEYSSCTLLWVIAQQFNSTPGRLTCELDLVGLPNLMEEDEASESYIPDEGDTKTVKELVEAICGATLTCFTGRVPYEVAWDTGYDTLANTYKPKDSFRIYARGTRLAALRRVLDYTANVARFEDDGKIHILSPVLTGVAYDYEYSLTGGHTFFLKAYRETLVIPNRIVVKSRPDDDPQYSGEAQTEDYATLLADVKKTGYMLVRLTSNAEAGDIATALIAKAKSGTERGAGEVPLNVGAEVYDYVKVTDQRQNDSRAGNIGYVHRRFGGGKWTMTFGFGNWLESLKYQGILKGLQTYTDIGNYFARLQVGSLYAYLDEILDGPDVYVRQRSLQLDATGVYVTELTLYAIRLPGEAEHNLWKGTTALANPGVGDFWIDTNYSPNVVKIWDGDSWENATTAQLADFNRGTILRRLKSAALTADGLVVMDQVQSGTYGKILTAALSASGLVLLDQTVDGTYGKILFSDLQAGSVKGGAIVQSASYRLTSDTEKGIWNAKIKTFYQTSAPTSGMAAGDLWFDTDDKNKIYRYSGTSWAPVRDADIAQALADAAAAAALANLAQATADSKIITFYQINPPTAEGVGDLWVDTNDGNKLYRWNGSSWVEIQDDAIAQAIADAADAQATADSKVVTFFQSSIPTSTDVGDLWIDLDDANKVYRAASIGANEIKAGEWVLARDQGIAEALAIGNEAYALAVDAYDLGVIVQNDLADLNDGIVAGYLTLSEYTEILGTWYKTGGVKINASTGIVIYGLNKALVTRASEFGTDQCYVGTDGAICAGGGDILLGSSGLKLRNEKLLIETSGGLLRGSLFYDNTYGRIRLKSKSCNLYLEGGEAGDYRYIVLVGTNLDASAMNSFYLPRLSSNPGSGQPHGMMVFNSATGYLNVYDTVYGGWWHVDRTGGWA